MGCGVILIGLGLVVPIVWVISSSIREWFEGSSGNISGLVLIIPFSLALLIIGIVIIFRSRSKPKILEDAIRDALGKSTGDKLTIDELTNLTVLRAEFSSITDLTGIKHCTNLRTLNLNNNMISDISPLSSLTNLTELRLNHNKIIDISPLVANSGLGEGDTVWLENNNLDLTEGSEDMQNIKALKDRGVEVRY